MDTESVGSTASMLSVGHNGTAMPLEQALDDTVRSLQRHLNAVQCHLREIAVIAERDQDFREEIKLSDELDDELREMGWLFEDLREMAYDLCSQPVDAEEKRWFAEHKKERKARDKRLNDEHARQTKEQRKAEREALKGVTAAPAQRPAALTVGTC